MLPYLAVLLPVLIGFCGLAVDVGRMELRTNQLQAAADAGALAGAGELMRSSSLSSAQTAAYNDALQVENANDIATATATAQQNSTFGFYVGDYSIVEVKLTQTFPTFFMGILKSASSSVTLTVKADAQLPPCALFMGSPTATSTYDFWIASSSMYTPIGCPSYFQDGTEIDGFANINGGQVRSHSTSASSDNSGWTAHPVMYSVPAIPDPLAYIALPSAGACLNASPISHLNQSTATTINLTAGTYCGKTATYTGTGRCNATAFTVTPAIDIQGTQSGSSCPNQSLANGGNCTTTPTVNFAPGLYVIIGGINFNCVTVTGSGVTLYFTKSGTVSYGLFKMISSTWNVSAPTVSSGGSIVGISVMNDPNWVGSGYNAYPGPTEDFQWTYGTYHGDGDIYLRGTGLDAYALSMNAPNYFNLDVANMYNYDANFQLSNNYSTIPTGNPMRLYPVLVQ